ncbi:hypothetical protein MRX96_005478 [Rhipicephalus microplus]
MRTTYYNFVVCGRRVVTVDRGSVGGAFARFFEGGSTGGPGGSGMLPLGEALLLRYSAAPIYHGRSSARWTLAALTRYTWLH